ncbi:MAG: putative quinol monooxygenase [Acidobacteriota bacterium]
MFTRVVQCTVKPEKKNEFSRDLRQILPQVRQQPGCIDVVELFSETNPNQFVCMTFWQTREALDRYNDGLFQQVNAKLTPYVTEVSVGNYTVETSTVHRIAAGKAA